MSDLIQDIIQMSNYVQCKSSDWKALHDKAVELQAENAALRVYERCLPILIRGLKDANCNKVLSEWDRARKLLEAENKKPPKG